MEHREGTFLGAGDTKLSEQSWRPSTPPKGVLVIVHGLKDHSGRYAEVAWHLVEQGYAVHSFDLRGHARSEGVRVYVDEFDDYVSDVEIFVERVRRLEPGLPIFMFGHDIGGSIVTLYAITRKPDIAGIVLSGAALKGALSGFATLATKMAAALSPKAAVYKLDPCLFSRDPTVVEATKNDPLVHQAAAPARTAKELINAIDRIQKRMEELTVPLLIMHGGADRVTSPDGSRQLNERARSERKTLVIFDELYHDLLHEPDRDKVEAQLIAWLDANTSAPAFASVS
ncbi:alpha/beta hydrolase [Pendulispora albinea]|uniref:Lysophospholipase n=1 Tax=Pendulispora albinea TaxID=2741071 RepID=A0ABZ2MAT2_9BACT